MANASIRRRCSKCNGEGKVSAGVGVAVEDPCTQCSGTGVVDSLMNVDNTAIMEKLDELKTKINQVQADINYIKTKVG